MASLAKRILTTRWLVRAPIPLFRAGLGFVFGGGLLLLEHTGRKSGRRRYVVLECVERPSKNQVVIASGFGAGSQWYANLRADPRCRVWIGTRRARPAVAQQLSVGEAHAVLDRYQTAHPKAYAELSGVIEEATGGDIGAVPILELALS